jgi:hypothetical protein
MWGGSAPGRLRPGTGGARAWADARAARTLAARRRGVATSAGSPAAPAATVVGRSWRSGASLRRPAWARRPRRSTPEALHGLYDAWVDCAEEAYARMAHGETYGTGARGGSQGGQRVARGVRRHAIESWAKWLDWPTRSEINSLSLRVRALEEQQRESKRKRADPARPCGQEATTAAKSEMPAAKASDDRPFVCGSVGRAALRTRLHRERRGLAIGKATPCIAIARSLPHPGRGSAAHRLCTGEPSLHDGPGAGSLAHPRAVVARLGRVSDRLGISRRRRSFHHPRGLPGGPARGLHRRDLESKGTRRAQPARRLSGRSVQPVLRGLASRAGAQLDHHGDSGGLSHERRSVVEVGAEDRRGRLGGPGQRLR